MYLDDHMSKPFSKHLIMLSCPWMSTSAVVKSPGLNKNRVIRVQDE